LERQDHTTSPSAQTPFVRAMIALGDVRPSHPIPNVRDDREPPLLWERDKRKEATDLGVRSMRETATDWHDGQITLMRHAPLHHTAGCAAASSVARIRRAGKGASRRAHRPSASRRLKRWARGACHRAALRAPRTERRKARRPELPQSCTAATLRTNSSPKQDRFFLRRLQRSR